MVRRSVLMFAVLTAAVVGVVPAASAGAAPSIIVNDTTPRETDFVTIDGSGWTPGIYVAGGTCALGDAALGDCTQSPFAFVTVDDEGEFSMSALAYRTIYSPNVGTVDCAVPGACALAVWNFLAPGQSSAEVPVVVTPFGTLTLSQTTFVNEGLTDVTGTGFPPQLGLQVGQCPGVFDSIEDDCVTHGVVTDDDGYFQTTVFVATSPFFSGCIDAPAGACAIVAWAGGPPGGPAPQVPILILSATFETEVTPTTDLRDGQRVRVRGERWPSDGAVLLLQCRKFGWYEDCDQSTRAVADVDDAGAFHARFAVRAVIVDSGERVDCTEEPEACTVMAFTMLDGRLPTDRQVPISFDPSKVTSHYEADEGEMVAAAATALGRTPEQFQRDAVRATAWILALAGVESITAPENSGPSAHTTLYRSAARGVIDATASRFAVTRGEFQKLSSLFVAALLDV
jgi:hypothetical protein